ncbi:MAG: peptidylprolyl isomerase [Deltaproteobacteria bacterium]|nr:peptidylprolyl isomerase [Deltaproteobacteria bacterium]
MTVIAPDQYVVLEYQMRLDSGEQIRGTNEAPDRLTFVAGYKELMPALERRLIGLREQDAVEFVIPADEAFGLYDAENYTEWSRKVFPPDMEIKVGQQVIPANLPFPPEYPLTVKEVKENSVLLDMNHPFAGHDLHYAVKVVEVRPATKDELEPLKHCKSCSDEMEGTCS